MRRRYKLGSTPKKDVNRKCRQRIPSLDSCIMINLPLGSSL